MKVIILNEATGWTIITTRENGEVVDRTYVSNRHHGSPLARANEIVRHYEQYGEVFLEHGGNSPDYDREIAAIAADPYFMS